MVVMVVIVVFVVVGVVDLFVVKDELLLWHKPKYPCKADI